MGANGVGKSNLLSIIADAVIEGASQHFSDVVEKTTGAGRLWFRVAGGLTLRVGERGGFSLLRFDDGGVSYNFRQKVGHFPVSEVPKDVSDALKHDASWADDETVKRFDISEEDSRRIYGDGSYTFFPASRAEMPHWLNGKAVPDSTFGLPPNIEGQLGHALFIERGMDRLGRWIASIILDSRPEVVVTTDVTTGQATWQASGMDFVSSWATRDLLNKILQIVLDDSGASFHWSSRKRGLVYRSQRQGAELPLSSLSSAQAILLMLFGTILMQCDGGGDGNFKAPTGISIIDEIDAHVHIDLAHRAIPALIRLFPSVQFLLSAHSPLFILGMRTQFGDDGFQVVELPTGMSISAEGFSEFQHALDVLRQTRAFDDTVAARVRNAQLPLLMCEGETDPRYLETAAELLNRKDVLEGLTLDWIGMRSASGGVIGSGKSNLDRLWQLLNQNPELASRPTVLLYDNDTGHINEDGVHNAFRRVMPTNESNTKMRDGIENLLDPAVLTEDMFSTTKRDHGNGTQTETTSLNKVKLCDYLCDVKRDPRDFAGFSAVLDMIAGWRAAVLNGG